MKTLALDLGDKWVGSAISDAFGITCRPYKTVSLENLNDFIQKTLHEEPIDTIIIGLPLTMKGTESVQTKKIIDQKIALEEQFSSYDDKTFQWILWDERLSSKRANSVLKTQKKGLPTKEDKQKDHSLAAAFILQSYLDSKAFAAL